VFSDNDVVGALKKAAARRSEVAKISSRWPASSGASTDVTCAGCPPDPPGIGGFHFPGVDWMAAKAIEFRLWCGLAAFLQRSGPAAAIIPDQLPRTGKAPDYSRGFSNRPAAPRQHRARRYRIRQTAGARIATCRLRSPPRATAAFAAGPAPRGLACQVAGKNLGHGHVLREGTLGSLQSTGTPGRHHLMVPLLAATRT